MKPDFRTAVHDILHRTDLSPDEQLAAIHELCHADAGADVPYSAAAEPAVKRFDRGFRKLVRDTHAPACYVLLVSTGEPPGPDGKVAFKPVMGGDAQLCSTVGHALARGTRG